MPEHRLIRDCVAELAAQLPPAVVAELADGLDQTRQHYLRQGLGPDAAARAALAEFGEPRAIVAAFTCTSPARRAARTLLATGPLAGACWAAVLISNHAWTWPVPPATRVAPGIALIAVIALLASASFSASYRSARRAAAAACLGLTALDATMLTATAVLAPPVIWPVIFAAAASAARISYSARALRAIHAG
jgi:hypothetical protein